MDTRRVLLDIYPRCADVLEANFRSLESSEHRDNMYIDRGTLTKIFENPVYQEAGEGRVLERRTVAPSSSDRRPSSKGFRSLNMSAKDFLSAIPSFSAFSDEQLTLLEKGAIEMTFRCGVSIVSSHGLI